MRVHAFDIGGANIKAASALIDESGALSDLRAMSLPFALWKSPCDLVSHLRSIQATLGNCEAMAFTMTAELCDCFATRREGVVFILDEITRLAGDVAVRFWSTQQGFVDPAAARNDWIAIASANWHAQASALARQYPHGLSLMLDVGSTTSDIVKLQNGEVKPIGLTDAQRLCSGELVYTGARRTPLMAVMNEWAEGSHVQPLMAERFATMADVHLLRGDLPEDENDCDTADEKPMIFQHAASRILRMIGSDLSIDLVETAKLWSDRFAAQQIKQISKAIALVMVDDSPDRVLVSGSGAFVAERVAKQSLSGCELVHWAQSLSPQASDAACAVALLLLWADPRTAIRGHCV